MKMHVEETYHIPGSQDPVKTCEDVCIRDESAVIGAYALIGATAEVTHKEMTEDHLEISLAVHPNRESVPGVIGLLLGYNALDYVQNTTYDFQTHTGVMETIMTHPKMRTKVSGKGTFNLRSHAPLAPRTITWTLDSEVKAKIWPISRQVESTIIDELKDRTTKIQAFNQGLIDQSVAEATEESLAA